MHLQAGALAIARTRNIIAGLDWLLTNCHCHITFTPCLLPFLPSKALQYLANCITATTELPLSTLRLE